VNSRQRRTHKRLFETPLRKDITWHEVMSLFEALGATVTQGQGSRMRVALHDVKAVFHQPHPHPELPIYAVKDIRDFLEHAGELP
jgi:HicA toxin of bacterial toxin-antitoxin,